MALWQRSGEDEWREDALSNSQLTPGVVPGRLPAEVIAENFADVEPPFDVHEARVAADRCYFCHDAPCVTACPTAIDIRSEEHTSELQSRT